MFSCILIYFLYPFLGNIISFLESKVGDVLILIISCFVFFGVSSFKLAVNNVARYILTKTKSFKELENQMDEEISILSKYIENELDNQVKLFTEKTDQIMHSAQDEIANINLNIQFAIDSVQAAGHDTMQIQKLLIDRSKKKIESLDKIIQTATEQQQEACFMHVSAKAKLTLLKQIKYQINLDENAHKNVKQTLAMIDSSSQNIEDLEEELKKNKEHFYTELQQLIQLLGDRSAAISADQEVARLTDGSYDISR